MNALSHITKIRTLIVTNLRKFCEKQNIEGKSLISLKTKNITANSRILAHLEKLDEEAIKDVIKYKIFEDSVKTTVENIKDEIPEISKHVEFRDWVNEIVESGKQDEVLMEHGIVILKQKSDLIHKYGIDMHNYRNFQDREYEVDIQEVLTKDLFENQRVVDNFVEENKDKINELVGYYQNKYRFTKHNRFAYLIYKNNYEKSMGTIKFNLIRQIIAVSAASLVLTVINPYLLLLIIPEYYALYYTSKLLNNLVHEIILTEDKETVMLRKYNFMGFKRDYPKYAHTILSINYINKFRNEIFQLKDKGFFFITRLLRRYFKKSSSTVHDNFTEFHHIKIGSKSFYIPADSSVQHRDTNEYILLCILNRQLSDVLEYDYSAYEDKMAIVQEGLENYKKEMAKKSHKFYISEEDKLKAEYCNFKPNRDYADQKYDLALKRPDDINGVYIDNGYR